MSVNPPVKKGFDIGQLAFLFGGFALVVSMGSLFFVRKHVTHLEDDVLALKAENEKLKAKMNDSERAVMEALALRLDGLREDLGLPSDAPDSPSAQPYAEDVIRGIGRPARTGDEIHVTVPADAMKAVLDNVSSLAAEVSVTPAVKDQKPDGFAIFEVREGGLVPALGFEQGDVIHAVNGMPFRTSDEILAVYDKVASAKRIEFEISRSGRPMKLVLEVGS